MGEECAFNLAKMDRDANLNHEFKMWGTTAAVGRIRYPILLQSIKTLRKRTINKCEQHNCCIHERKLGHRPLATGKRKKSWGRQNKQRFFGQYEI
jgi:hypothetical protein